LRQGSCRVFATTIGTMLEQHNVRCGFRQITRAVGLCDEWVPGRRGTRSWALCPRAASQPRRSPGGRPPADQNDRVGLPPWAAPSNHHWRRDQGPDLSVL